MECNKIPLFMGTSQSCFVGWLSVTRAKQLSAGLIEMPLSMRVDLGQGHIVLNGVGFSAPNFRFLLT